MKQFEIEVIKHKNQQADKAEQRRRYNIACEIAVMRKQKFEEAHKGKKTLKKKHLLSSFSIGLACGITVIFFMPSTKSTKKINDNNISTSKKSITSTTDIPGCDSPQIAISDIHLKQNNITVIPQSQNYTHQEKITRHSTVLKPRQTSETVKNQPSPLFADLQKTYETPEILKKRKIKEIQEKVKNAANKKKAIRKNKKKRIVKKTEKHQKKKKSRKKYSLPPDLRAEMMGK